MIEFFRNVVASDFMPHSHCYLMHKDVLWLHVISDGSIALSYLTIPAALFYFVKKRKDMVFSWMFVMFALFILGCGMTHFFEVWTAWDPIYRLSGLVKAITAIVSAATAVALWRLIPAALALPSPDQFRRVLVDRESELLRRGEAEARLLAAHTILEDRVHERTAELAAANEALRAKVAECQRIEDELRRSQQLFQAIMDHSPAVIYIKDLESRYLFVNRQFEKVFGASAEEARGRSAHDILPAELADAHRSHDLQTLRALEPLEFEEVVAGEDGAHTYLAVRFPLPGPDGRLHAIGGIARDITESKKAAEEIRQAKDEAEKASHAKSEFLSRMSHELRTPMNAVLGFGQILEMDPKLNASERGAVEQILLGGKHLLALINEVLDISRIDAGGVRVEIETVDVAATFEVCLELMRPLAEQRSIQLVIDPMLRRKGHIRADRRRFKQVALNLLSNAIKYNRPAGTVTVAYESADEHRLRVTVRDTGAGLTEDELERSFEPFERLGAETSGVEGAGLGLTLSRRLVHLMGGELGARSVLGEGSTFWIELPRDESSETEPIEPVPEVPSIPAAPFRERTVLYIEDNLSNLRLIESILELRPGTVLHPAMQGRLGLDLAREQHPHLILLDLQLPDVPGSDLLRQLQSNPVTCAIPIVILSADATPAKRAEMLAAGARAYLTKPIEVREFLQILDELLDSGQGAS